MQLVACPTCHTQYDVEGVEAPRISCRCGEVLENREPVAVDAVVHRCGSCAAQISPDDETCAYCGSSVLRDLGKLSLICPECGGRNEDAARFCVACGVGFSPEPIPEEGREVPCPCCGVLMPPQSVGGVAVNECPQCNGLWAPADHLDQLIRRALKARADDPSRALDLPRRQGSNPMRQKVQYRKCPECDGYMQRMNFQRSSGVILDRCAEHGSWLDADELEQIVGFLLAGGAKDYRPHLSGNAQKAAAAFARMQATEIQRRYEGRDDMNDGLLGLLSKLLR